MEAIGKGRDIAKVADEIHDQNLGLTDDTIDALRERLSHEIEECRKLNAALKVILDRRTGASAIKEK